MSKADITYDNYQNKKYNCCECLLMTYGEDVGIPKELLPRLGTGFGGGVAHMGYACGIINAVTILLNAQFGRNTIDDGEIDENFAKIKDFYKEFKDEYGSIYCKGLTKYNFAKDDQFQEWLSSGGRNKCADMVKRAAEIYEGIVSK